MMSRQKGSRNKRYKEEKDRLSDLLFRALIDAGDEQVSFRQLAVACDVSPATLRHYFGTRKGAVRAAMERAGGYGKVHTDLVEKGDFGHAEEALLTLLRYMYYGWKHSELGELHRFGLVAGLGDDEVGPVYVRSLLEPTLQAFEVRLQLHVERGELVPMDVRFGSLSLLSPVIIGLLHQHQLHGCEERPLDVEAFLLEHVHAFVRAHRPVEETSTPTAA
jgi:AcrR family transcriptional regulator